MKTIRVANVSTLVAGVLLSVGLTVPAEAGEFQVTLNKANPLVHVDVLSGAGDWDFSYTVTGKVSLLGLAIKNNPSAGDFCWGAQVRKPKGSNQEITAQSIPEATLNACGVQFQDTNGIPLNLDAYVQGADPNGSIVISVAYPDP
jgi:hypothetical protein